MYIWFARCERGWAVTDGGKEADEVPMKGGGVPIG